MRWLSVYAAALSGKVSPLSLITFEGNPIYSRRAEGEFPWLETTREAAQQFEAAFAANDPDAPAVIIDYWGTARAFRSMPQQFQDYCRSTVFSNILDWRSAIGFTPILAIIMPLKCLVRLPEGNSLILRLSIFVMK